MLTITPINIYQKKKNNGINFNAAVSEQAISYKNKGNEHLKYNRTDKAIENYKKAISISPKYADAYFNLGKAYLFNKQYTLSQKALETASELEPNDTETHIVLGEAYKNDGKYTKAIKSFETALTLEPDSDYAKRNLLETKNYQLSIYNPKTALAEKRKQALTNLNSAINIARNYLPKNYFENLKDIKIDFDTTELMGGQSNIAQYEHAKRKITVTSDYIWAHPQLVCAYLIHEFVHAKDNDPYTSITEEQDAYEQAAKFWAKTPKNIKDPEMDYVVELYQQSTQTLKDRVAEIYKLRDPDISQTSPNHPAQNSNASTSLSDDTNAQPLKHYNVIA